MYIPMYSGTCYGTAPWRVPFVFQEDRDRPEFGADRPSTSAGSPDK